MTDASTLSPRDMLFLAQVSNVFNMPNLGNLVLSGDVNKAINYAHTNGLEPLLDPGSKDWMSGYDGGLLTPVTLAVEANIAKEKANPPKGYFARLYAKMGWDAATSHQRLYNKYLGR